MLGLPESERVTMPNFEFTSFPEAKEDARALLARLYREIGVSAVAAALDLDIAPVAPSREAIASLQQQAYGETLAA
jgi:hypothetical protein